MSARALCIWLCAAGALLSSGALVASAATGSAVWPVPATARQVAISSGVPRQPPTIKLTVSQLPLVTRVVKLFNSFPAAPRVMYMCPMLTDPKLITVTFRSSTGESLAVATYEDFKPWNGPSGPCKAVELRVGRGHERALVGGDFLRTLERMLGRSLT